jgi:hypothetical protein
MRIRRTKEEIEAGLTVAQKKKGVTLADVSATQKEKQRREKIVKSISPERKKRSPNIKYDTQEVIKDTFEGPVKYIYKTNEVIKKVEIEVPVVKEVRILNGLKKTEKTVQHIMDEELGKCIWEWKHVALDSKFKVKDLDVYGKDRWKFAFIHSSKISNPKSVKPDIICFQRPKQ